MQIPTPQQTDRTRDARRARLRAEVLARPESTMLTTSEIEQLVEAMLLRLP